MTSESQIIIYNPDVNLTERKSALNNNIQEVVTVGELVGTTPYKVYTALLIQTGANSFITIDGSSAFSIGVTYEIMANPNDEDLTTIGAPNNNIGTKFVCTESVDPNTYTTDLELRYDEGTPVLTILENTLDFDIYWQMNNTGYYFAVSNGGFNRLKTHVIIGSVVSSTASTKAYRFTDNYVGVKTYSSGTTLGNSILSFTPIEIRVYN
jgi:hypothetical protein